MENQEKKEISITALMTAPRTEPVFARNYIEIALRGAGIPLTVSGGVFYSQCMQRMMIDCIAKGTEYALTVDFDSMFTVKHVARLLSLIVQYDEIDAIAAIQPKRGTGEILAAVSNTAQTVEYKGVPLKVDSAHFGLTVIDLNKLKTVPKPWFMGVPNENGDWEGDKLDDDVYFWRKWKEAGHSVYIDPGTRLGHLEEMITVFDDEMKIEHLYPNAWVDIRETTVD